jgi:hypothetical protein
VLVLGSSFWCLYDPMALPARYALKPQLLYPYDVDPSTDNNSMQTASSVDFLVRDHIVATDENSGFTSIFDCMEYHLNLNLLAFSSCEPFTRFWISIRRHPRDSIMSLQFISECRKGSNCSSSSLSGVLLGRFVSLARTGNARGLN